MNYSIQINESIYPILDIADVTMRNNRESKRIDLEMSHEDAAKLFVDNIDMTLIKSYQLTNYIDIEVPRTEVNENGEEYTVIDLKSQMEITDVNEETDLSDYCIAADIVDYRDGRLSVYMSKTSEQDLLEVIGPKASTKRELTNFIECVDSISKLIPDELAATHKALFNTWKVETNYEIGDRVIYKDVLYKVLQNHTSQADWTPETAPSLFAKILTDTVSNEILPWEQPDSTNPYQKGDKVSHNGQNWVSNVDNNVWEPGVYGWDVE